MDQGPRQRGVQCPGEWAPWAVAYVADEIPPAVWQRGPGVGEADRIRGDRRSRSEVVVDLGALGGTRTPNLLIRRLCRAHPRPGHSAAGPAGWYSVARVVFRCYSLSYGQNQTTTTSGAPGPAEVTSRLRSTSPHPL